MRGEKYPPSKRETADQYLFLAKSYGIDGVSWVRRTAREDFVYEEVHYYSAKAAHYAHAYLRATKGD